MTSVPNIPRFIAITAILAISACSDSYVASPQDNGKLKGTIAFVCEFDQGDNDELCLLNPDGSNLRRITNNAGPDLAPAWSPDGTKLSFNSRRPPHSDRPQIYSYNLASKLVLRISSSDVQDHRPSWTPNGQAVVFQRGDFLSGFELYRQAERNGHPQQLTTYTGHISAAGSYSPDGQFLLFQSNFAIDDLFPFSTYIVDVASGSTTQLATSVTDSHDGPRFSPDGTKVAFAAAGNLFTVDRSTGSVSQITHGGFYDLAPDWSPDGSMLVFQSDRKHPDTASLHIIELETGAIHYIGDGRTPVWTATEH